MTPNIQPYKRSTVKTNDSNAIIRAIMVIVFLFVTDVSPLFHFLSTTKEYQALASSPHPIDNLNSVTNAPNHNESLAAQSGIIKQFQIDPNNAFVIYSTDNELWKMSMFDSTDVVKLSDASNHGSGKVGHFEIDPKGKYVVYRADTRLYSVQISNTKVIPLPQGVVGGSDNVADFQVDSEGRYVVYRTGVGIGGYDLYRVSIEGGESVILNDYPAIDYQISPDGNYVVYSSGDNAAAPHRLHSVLITNGSSNFLKGGSSSIQSYQISPDSNHVVVMVKHPNDGTNTLFYVSIDNRSREWSEIGVESYQMTSDGSGLVYLTRTEAGQVGELQSISFDDMLYIGGLNEGRNVDNFKISPDNEYVIYLSQGRLYIVPIAGGGSIVVNTSYVQSNGSIDFQFSPDGAWIIYDTGNGLYSVPTESGAVTKLGAVVGRNQVLPDSSRVIYSDGQPDKKISELYRVPIEGGTPIKLNDLLAANNDVVSFKISPDSQWVVYGVGTEEGITELFVKRIPSSSLVVSKKVSKDIVGHGEQVTYSIDVTTINGVASVTLTDTLPTGVTFVESPTPGVTFDSQANQLFYNGVLEPDMPLQINYTVQVTDNTDFSGLLYSEVEVSSLGDLYLASAGFIVPRVGPPITLDRLNIIVVNADNDLDRAARELFEKAEMATADLKEQKTLLLIDWPGNHNAYLYELQSSEGKQIKCALIIMIDYTCDGRYIEGQTVWKWGEAVSTSSSLTEFLVLAMNTYSAHQITLSLVGHGGGWAPDLYQSQPRYHDTQPTHDPLGGLLIDMNPVSSLSTRQLGKALREATARSGHLIDLLYLDACLMAMSEVAYEVRDSVKYLLASANWSWTSFQYVKHLSLPVDLSTEEVGKRWMMHEADQLRAGNYPFTYSLFDLSSTEELLVREDALANALITALMNVETKVETKDRIRSAFIASSCFDGDQDFLLIEEGVEEDDYYCDLYSFSQELIHEFERDSVSISDQEIIEAAGSLKTLIDDRLIKGKEVNPGNPNPWHIAEKPWSWNDYSGVSKYVPLGAPDYKRAYYTSEYLQSAADGKWDEFLAAYWGDAIPEIPPEECQARCNQEGPLSLSVSIYLPLIVH